MTQVAEIIRFYSLKEIMEYMQGGGEYPLHHLWCFDQIKKSGITVDCIEYNKNSWWNKTGKKIRILNLQQQLNLLKNLKKYDLIFAPFIEDIFLLALLKTLGLLRKPILGIPMNRYTPYKTNFIKRQRQKVLRHILFNGIDCLLFLNKNLYDYSVNYKTLKNCHAYMNNWGVDYPFFESFINEQTKPATDNFIYSTGGSGRDFKVLFEAFKHIDFPLKVTTKKPLDRGLTKNLPSNIIIDNSITPGLQSVGLIRHEYFNCRAVAIPLLADALYAPIGVTVLMEAMAMAKPVVSTHNNNYPFNLEKEKIGFYVDLNDVKGWQQCIQYMVDNPEKAKEMGARAQYLAKTKYNYQLFSDELIGKMERISNSRYQLQNATSLESA